MLFTKLESIKYTGEIECVYTECIYTLIATPPPITYTYMCMYIKSLGLHIVQVYNEEWWMQMYEC